MKEAIHPATKEVVFNCNCGNSLTVLSTLERESFSLEVCDKCHPFYTGKHRIVDTAGAVEKFKERFSGLADSMSDSND